MLLLITGGAGFIGSNLAAAAVTSGHTVRVVDDLSTGSRENLRGLDVELVEGSILDSELMVKAMHRADSVAHLAALASVPLCSKEPLRAHAINVTGTLTVLEAARAAGVAHVVTSSSAAVYGLNPATPATERDWVRPLSPYGASKLASEQYLLSYQQTFGLATSAFRLFNVFGPRQRPDHSYAPVVPAFLEAIVAGNPLWVDGDGSQSRDFTYIRTVCDVMLSAAEANMSVPEPVNVASGSSTSLLQLIAALEDVTGVEADVRYRAARPGDVSHSQADVTAMQRLFPNREHVSLNAGLRRTLEWRSGTSGGPR